MVQVQEHPELRDEGGDIEVRGCGLAVDGQEPGLLGTLSLPTGTVVSLPMLQRLRRRFTQIQRGAIAHGQGHVTGETEVGEAFLRFLNGEMEG